MALLAIGMGLTSCDEQLDNAVDPGDNVAVTSLTLDKATLTMKVGDAAVTLTATVAPDNATDKTVTWSSNKEDVATVDANGLVTAVAMGTAIITAKAGDKSATCEVTVTPSLSTPLTLEVLSEGAGTIVIKSPKVNMKYSKNGETPTTITSTADVTIDVTKGDKVEFYGNGTNITTYNGTKIAGGTAEVKVYGNIMSLVDETEFATATTLPGTENFVALFATNTNLTDASGLLLPAMTLANMCYESMFALCANLTTAPKELPAETLANYCYSQMFGGCHKLTSAPKELPAKTLAMYCYGNMFESCVSLTTAPKLKATTLANNCCEKMFYGCTSLTIVPALEASTLADQCCKYMFAGCTSLVAAPELKATPLASSCYQYMFQNCTSLTAAPELKAETLANGCYANMFEGCTSLVAAPELKATSLANSCYRGMFYGCTSLTAAPELNAETLKPECYRYMFYGCTSLVAAPTLPAETLVESCYSYMFQGCTNLNVVTCLATHIGASNCTDNWLDGVAATGTFYKASSMTYDGTGTKTDTNYPNNANGIPGGWNYYNYAP